LASWVNIKAFRETGKWEKRSKRGGPASSTEDERKTVSNPSCRRTRMRRALGVAAVAAVLWIGTANYVQGFS
jgi:hypothetical protein